ncbi:hypothetical protein EON80_11140 [bacterium]|nr:MAG: hypothetical protein EON80_11140 [bacterium]
MKPFLKNPIALSALALILLGGAFVGARSLLTPKVDLYSGPAGLPKPDLTTGPVKIGDFTLPELDGWERKVTRSERMEMIKYEKKENGTRLYIGLNWNIRRSKKTYKTSAELKKIMEAGSVQVEAMMKRLKVDIKSDDGPVTSNPFNGMVAVQRPTSTTSKNGINTGQSTIFLHGSNFYNLNFSITVPPDTSIIAPTLKAELNRAYQTVTKSLN